VQCELGQTGLVDADVVVIGAGALGLSTALHCAMAGRSVVVVERLTAGSQASGRAAGLFKSVQADELRTRLARRSIDRAASFRGGCPRAQGDNRCPGGRVTMSEECP
jgi:glycine/D-amino acid oxidase-like deaminating enzyme